MKRRAGVKNEDTGRDWCRTMAECLEAPERQLEHRMAARQAAEWLRAIAAGADPARVIFGDSKNPFDRHGIAVATVVQARINVGSQVNAAIKSVAADFGISVASAKKTYYRYVDKIDRADPLGKDE